MVGLGVIIKRLIYNKWLILLFNTVFFVLMAWLLPIHFEENDDVLMCMIANGVHSGTPDGHLVFINALYGWVLAGLYRLTTEVEWYTLSFCVLHVLAMTGIVYFVIKDGKMQPLMKGLFLAFMYVMWVRMIIAFQFTTTAGLLCFSGCLALLQSSKKWRFVGISAIFVASLIRFQAAGLVGLLFAPVLILEFIEDKHTAYWIAAVAVLAIVGRWADGSFYRQADWAYYKAYNEVRGFINDNPNARLVENDLPNGVDLADYQMLCFFAGDPNAISLEQLQEIKVKIKSKVTLKQALLNMSQFSLYRIPIVLILLGVIICIILNYCNLKQVSLIVYMPIVLLLLWGGLMLYIGATSSLKNRVFVCMLLPLSCFLMVSIPLTVVDKGRLLCRMMALIMLGLILKYFNQCYNVVKSNQSNCDNFVSYQWPLLKEQKGVLFLGSCKVEYLPVMKIKDTPFQVVNLGWSTCIPFQKGILESYLDFVDTDILFFFEADSPPTGISKSIERNYGIKNEIETVCYNDKYALYKFVSK